MGSMQLNSTIYYFVPFLSLFALKLYRLSRIGKLGFFKRPLLFHRIPLFSLSSLPLPFFYLLLWKIAYRIRRCIRGKFIYYRCVTMNSKNARKKKKKPFVIAKKNDKFYK